MTDQFKDFLEHEISFHREHRHPWHYRLYHWLTRQRPANEIVVNELEYVGYHYEMCGVKK